MNAANKGTVKAVSPWPGLQIIPFLINEALTGASVVTPLLKISAMSPERCEPSPISAIALKYSFSEGFRRSKRTLKKLSSNEAIVNLLAFTASSNVMGDCVATSQVCFPHSCMK